MIFTFPKLGGRRGVSVLKRLDLIAQMLIILDKHVHNIIMTQQELKVAMDNLTIQVSKVAKEQSDRYDVLVAKIAELEAIIAAGGTIGPELVSAFNGVQSAVDSLDAAIPDPPPVEPPAPPA